MIRLEKPVVTIPGMPKDWAQWIEKLWLLVYERANEYRIGLLGTKEDVNMTTAGSTTIFTTKRSKKTRITHVVVRDTSSTLAGGTSFSFTSFRQAVDLSTMTTPNTTYIVIDGNNAIYSEIGSNTPFQITVTVGATLAATAKIDVFGYMTE